MLITWTISFAVLCLEYFPPSDFSVLTFHLKLLRQFSEKVLKKQDCHLFSSKYLNSYSSQILFPCFGVGK